MSASAKHSVARAAGAMGAATFLSRILGLVREQVFAVLFGAGNATDAFNIAFRIPNLLRDLFAEGAMSSALVPTFTRVRREEGEERAWRVAGLVFRVLGISVGLLAAVGVVAAPWLVEVYASAFRQVPGKFELTVSLTRTMFPFFPLVALAAAFMGILNACGLFFLPALSSALFNLASIVTGVVLYFFLPRFGLHPIEGMAIGVVVGGVVQAFCQWPALRRAGYRWVPRSDRHPRWREDPALRRMLALMVPGTVGLAATQVNVLVNSVLATSAGPGAVSWLNYAFRLMQFPIGIFGVSLASATLPRVSALWVDRDVQGVAGTLSKSLRQVFAVNLPASAGLAFLGYPIVELLFQYGSFNAADTQATAIALAAYAVGLTAYSAVKVLVPACYALGSTRVAVVSSMLSVAATIILNLAMVGPFGYLGLALGTSIAALLNAGFLLRAVKSLLQQAGGDLPILPLVRSFLLQLVAAVAMGGACWLTHTVIDGWIPEVGAAKAPIRAVKTLLLVFEGVLLTLLLARVLRIEETTEVVELFVSKIKNKLSRRRN